MIGAPIAGLIFDLTKSYNIYMIIGGTLTLLTVLLVILGTNEKAIATIQRKKESLNK